MPSLPPPSDADLPAAAPGWSDDWFEQASACLWCAGQNCRPLISGVRDWFFAAVPGEFAFARCAACGSLLLERRPRAEFLGEAYRGYYTHTDDAEAGSAAGAVQRIGQLLSEAYARRRYAGSRRVFDAACAAAFGLFPVRRAEVDARHRYLPRRPVEVLDYGCGNGAFLARAAALGHRVAGADFDPEAVAVARRRGLDVVEPAALSAPEFAGRFDLITAAHVIEHVADPLGLLRDFRRWLKPGGLLFIEVPNAEAAGLSKHGMFWRGLEAPRHFSLPSAHGLRLALGEAGFAPVMIGQRAFAHHFMDAASREAARAGGEIALKGKVGEHFSGPEVLTCLARAC